MLVRDHLALRLNRLPPSTSTATAAAVVARGSTTPRLASTIHRRPSVPLTPIGVGRRRVPQRLTPPPWTARPREATNGLSPQRRTRSRHLQYPLPRHRTRQYRGMYTVIRTRHRRVYRPLLQHLPQPTRVTRSLHPVNHVEIRTQALLVPCYLIRPISTSIRPRLISPITRTTRPRAGPPTLPPFIGLSAYLPPRSSYRSDVHPSRSSAVSSILNPTHNPSLESRNSGHQPSTNTTPAFSTPARQQSMIPPVQTQSSTNPAATTRMPSLPVTQPTTTQDTSRRTSMTPSFSSSQSSYYNASPLVASPASITPRQSMEYYNPLASTEPPWMQQSNGRPSRGAVSSRSDSGAASRPASRQSSTAYSVVSAPPTGYAPVTPQQKQQQPTAVYTPGGGGAVPWMPPGAARPQNVYERRF